MGKKTEFRAYHFGEFMEGLRRAKRYSQAELAEHCGVDMQTISNIEVGKHLPSLDLFVKIAENLDWKPSDIFKRLEDKGIIEEIKAKNEKSK